MNTEKKIYFASDFHLGIPNHQESLIREKLVVKWLDTIKADAEEIYLLGDLFDFWFEYKTVVPKGHVRILGKLAELRDEGIPVYCFTGNHDLWMFGYFEKELNIPVYHDLVKKELNGKKFVIGHGDGIGPSDKGYKFLKKVFTSKLCQWLFQKLHPNLGIRLAKYWSHQSRSSNGEGVGFLGEDKEWQILYAKDVLEKEAVDYFIFGHRHLPLDLELTENCRFINLGDWISSFTYAVFDGKDLELKQFKESL